MSDNSKYWKLIEELKKQRLGADDTAKLKALEAAGFTGTAVLDFGKITVHFFKGGIGFINKVFKPIRTEESIKLE